MLLRKTVVATAVTIGLLSMESAHACGDKFLIVGRGSRFQRAYVSIHPASLLVLNNGSTGQREIQSRLKIAGHRLQIVKLTEVAGALATGRFDFVLADFRDFDSVTQAIPTGQPTTVLPVIDASSKSDMAAAAKEYKCLLQDAKGMKGARHFLAALDVAMESKLKAADLRCDVKTDSQ